MLVVSIEETEKQASTEMAASQSAYERVRHTEDQVATLTKAAAQRERDIEAHNAAHAEQTVHLHKQIASYRAAYETRVGELETQIASYRVAYETRVGELETQVTSYREAYRRRVGELESQVTALTEAAIERERQLQQRRETNYQLLMIHQNRLAEFKDLDPEFPGLYERCRLFTMTSIERLHALYQSVEYICASGLEGDFAECGVWQGGSCMLMALALMRHRSTGRQLWMFDTFAGHPEPDAELDIDLWGNRAIDEWRRHQAEETAGKWGVASLPAVRDNLASTGYPEDRLRFIKGMVEDTIPKNVPDSLAILRLDTDWYESTKVALVHFYPRLVSGGVMIVDDYGHYRGQRQAVDEYLRELGESPLLHRVDYSCRVMVKR
jgi:hypothetical protein